MPIDVQKMDCDSLPLVTNVRLLNWLLVWQVGSAAVNASVFGWW